MAQRRWLRLDAGWMDTEWLVPLSPAARLAWITLLSYCKLAGTRGTVRAMSPAVAARRWDIPEDDIQDMLSAAMEDGAVTLDDDADWVVAHWREYQEPDKTASERKQKQRDRESRRDKGVTPLVTPRQGRDPSRATETETETKSVPPSTPPVLTYPCSGKAPSWDLTTEQVQRWAELYPGLDITDQARRALAWIEANPTRRKTARGMPRFLANWLSRCNDRGSQANANGRTSLPVTTSYSRNPEDYR